MSFKNIKFTSFNGIIISLILFLGGCANKPYVISQKPVTPIALAAQQVLAEQQVLAALQVPVYVVSHGWHTGFVIKNSDIAEYLPQLKDRFDLNYIEFGWGDEGFYKAPKITAKLALQAMLLPTSTVIHAVNVPEDIGNYFSESHVQTIFLDLDQYQRLIEFIVSSFARDQYGNILPVGNGIYGDSQFYKAIGSYYILNTCNKWTAKGLKSAGMNISPTFKLTAGSIIKAIDKAQSKL
ncbi:hypothetical protein AwWohl_11820 [Gammaproteobacteria bacterium]|nr:hypothetical protein AwWohl_11820 [Gammaproteobacteria bacterium]